MAFPSLTLLVCFLALLDTSTDPQVSPLIEQLGSPRYRDREAASEALYRLGRRAIFQLEAAKAHPDPEIAARSRRLVERYYDIQPTSYSRLPWIDMMPDCTRALQREYLQRAGWSEFVRQGNDWPNYRQATYLWSRDLLRTGIPKTLIVPVLDQMAERETEYRRRHNMPP